MRTCIILDTNQWDRMPMLRHELGAALLFAVRDPQSAFIGLPTVVKSEVLIHLIEKYQKAQQRMDQASGEIRQIFGMSQEVGRRRDEEVEQAFDVRISDLGSRLEVIECTDTDMIEAGKMVLGYSPPSTRTSQQYRDSVLWCTALRMAEDNDVLLITNDGGFYQGKDNTRLDPALADEMDRLGRSVKLFRDVESLLGYWAKDKPSLPDDEFDDIKANFVSAVAEAIRATIGENGFAVLRSIDCNIALFLTEDPNHLAISGNIEYELVDPEYPDTAEPPAVANVSAIAAVQLDELDTDDIQLDSLRIDAITPHGDFKIADIRYVRATESIGTRWQHYRLRSELEMKGGSGASAAT